MTYPVQFARTADPDRGPLPPAGATASTETSRSAVQCALCGHRFVPDADTMSCARCPMVQRCAVTCCPHCGYEFVTRSRLVDLFRRIFRR